MDPLNTVVQDKDTTYALMQGASRIGHRVVHVLLQGVHLLDGSLQFTGLEVIPTPGSNSAFRVIRELQLEEDEVDVIFVRKDPPFDERYLECMWLLEFASKGVLIMNSPQGLRDANEKIWSLRFPGLTPRTALTSSTRFFADFLASAKDIIAKPVNGHGGKGVFRIRQNDTNAAVIFETLSESGSRTVVLQEYVKAAESGDKRILVLGGKPIGAVLRKHSQKDHRNNLFAGGTAMPCEITGRDHEIIAGLAPELQAAGLHFVGIDIIGDFLIEVNVTSPTCLQEMNRFYSVALEDQVVAYATELLREHRNSRFRA